MKDKVVELKRVISERDQLIRAVPELEKRTYAQDLSKIFIKVHHLCGPDILLRMGQATKLIYQNRKERISGASTGPYFPLTFEGKTIILLFEYSSCVLLKVPKTHWSVDTESHGVHNLSC